MASKLDNSTKTKLWVIFTIFMVLIVGLLVVEVNSYLDIMEARQNLEQLRKFEMREMQKEYLQEGPAASTDSKGTDTTSQPDDSVTADSASE
ncbi:hypothetical protein KFE98_08370 [bacterium SCSIO 12741]|nr:hypothetical protein KFE98_08370 [bacterium SCSIO 12741]